MNTSKSSPQSAKMPSSVRHTRAIQRDRSKRPIVAAPAPVVAAHLTALIHPHTVSQIARYRDLGLRERLLTLPVMVALVLSMIWRQIGSVATLLHLLTEEGFLWTAPVQVSEQALSQRLRVFPAALFQQVVRDLLPTLQARWQDRRRPLPPELAWARAHYGAVLAVDGSTLDALLRKVGLLRECAETPLAGRMTALLDLCSRLPRQLWYEADAAAHDQRHWPQIVAAIPRGALVVFDLGYTNFARFAELTQAPVTFVTRAKSNLAYTVVRSLRRTAAVHEAIVGIGTGEARQHLRLIEVLWHGTWHRYLTNELDPTVLPTEYAVALYWQRWRIEDAVNLVKRLLGLAYLWVGSANGVAVQLWATWLLYAVLVDLTDAVAEELNHPFAALSLEMVYRSLYFFTSAYQRGEATDPVAYLAQKAARFGIIKRQRQTTSPSRFKELALTLASGP
ncbi:MAG: IS4 family transposase [Candidatus Dormibacteraceae bacterium]